MYYPYNHAAWSLEPYLKKIVYFNGATTTLTSVGLNLEDQVFAYVYARYTCGERAVNYASSFSYGNLSNQAIVFTPAEKGPYTDLTVISKTGNLG